MWVMQTIPYEVPAQIDHTNILQMHAAKVSHTEFQQSLIEFN